MLENKNIKCWAIKEKENVEQFKEKNQDFEFSWLDSILGFVSVKEKNYSTLVKMVRQTLFQTIVIGVKTIAIEERDWALPWIQ